MAYKTLKSFRDVRIGISFGVGETYVTEKVKPDQIKYMLENGFIKDSGEPKSQADAKPKVLEKNKE